MSLLDRFVGTKLLDCLINPDSSGFEFECGNLAAYNPVRVHGDKSLLIGGTVKGIAYEHERRLTIEFTNGIKIEVSLDPNDYQGPEAFCATFSDGLIVVE